MSDLPGISEIIYHNEEISEMDRSTFLAEEDIKKFNDET